MKIIVTGGAGFIGSNFVFHMLKKYPDYRLQLRLPYVKQVSGLPDHLLGQADLCRKSVHTGTCYG